MIKKYTILLLLAGCACAARAQTPAELRAMLPAVDGWTLSDKTEVFNRDNLFDRINGAADVFLICNFEEMTTLDYLKDGSKTYVTLQMYRHATPADTFAIYSAERTPDMTFLDIGAEGYRAAGMVYFLSGSMYIKLMTADESAETAAMMENVARALARKIDPRAALPAMLKTFPAEGKQPRSEMYIVESFLGHKFLNSAWRAAYTKDGKEYQVFVIDGKTKAGAENMLADYLKFVKQTERPEEGLFTVRDRFNGDIPLLWRGRYLFGIINDSGAQVDAGALLAQMALTAQD
ncbi:MAG: hypothetical protein LBI02_11540 [Opitutaceae bacterium]|jgi:mRNA-degrading endonuclease HigB of HigAB toxin-antitoxin module|nr:hypothetical protein [Opitutaceae bacterium]